MTSLTFVRRPGDQFLTPFLFGDSLPARPIPSWKPVVDVFETDTGIRIEAELPGVPREDIRLRHHDGVLTISGGPRRTADGADAKDAPDCHDADPCVCRERPRGRFSRSFRLPDTVDPSGIRAETRDGILTVLIPRAEKALPREIEVSVG